jgi:hypothetical protein
MHVIIKELEYPRIEIFRCLSGHFDDLLPNSSLLTVAGWGHTSLFLSQCADAIVFEYLLTATAPAGGAVCQQDFNPFDIPPAPLATPESADRHQVRTELLGHVAFQPPSLTR